MYYREIKKRKNSRKYTWEQQFTTKEAVIDYLKEKELKVSGIPYIFTHINLSDGSILTEKDDNFGLLCSPQSLYGQLQAKGF